MIEFQELERKDKINQVFVHQIYASLMKADVF